MIHTHFFATLCLQEVETETQVTEVVVRACAVFVNVYVCTYVLALYLQIGKQYP